jgi:signal transduction histidine kinase
MERIRNMNMVSRRSILLFSLTSLSLLYLLLTCNLLNNAVKFTKEGTIVTTVKEEEDQQRNQLIVSVKDSGDGIDPDILPKLFSKFTTKSYHGTGLGLYICKGIIEAHGGKIWGENNVGGKGATFTFSIPFVSNISADP